MVDKPGVFTAKAVHERFLGAPGLRLIPDSNVVRQTILKALGAGKVVVRLPEGRTYDQKGCVEGTEGRRRRSVGSQPAFRLEDDVLIARADSPLVVQWLKEDKSELGLGEGGPGGFPPPPPTAGPSPGPVLATSWERLIEMAETRPLMELELTAPTPATAAKLMALAQPLGADSLSLSVSVSGESKDGGALNFSAAEVKPNNPVKPLQLAQTLFNAMAGEPVYEAQLRLNFGPTGRTGMQESLQQMSQEAPEDLRVQGRFEKASVVTV